MIAFFWYIILPLHQLLEIAEYDIPIPIVLLLWMILFMFFEIPILVVLATSFLIALLHTSCAFFPSLV